MRWGGGFGGGAIITRGVGTSHGKGNFVDHRETIKIGGRSQVRQGIEK